MDNRHADSNYAAALEMLAVVTLAFAVVSPFKWMTTGSAVFLALALYFGSLTIRAVAMFLRDERTDAPEYPLAAETIAIRDAGEPPAPVTPQPAVRPSEDNIVRPSPPR